MLAPCPHRGGAGPEKALVDAGHGAGPAEAGPAFDATVEPVFSHHPKGGTV
ncbi:hypothetical protein [Streptomyces sp. NPDC058739]|uniref:hypothetical protein n=1 Tax=Streptomyces sp. NPDC058739 TaxID=3346618 RepID=UPI00368B1CBA